MNILRAMSDIAPRIAILRRRIILPAVFGIALLFPPQLLHAQTRKGNQITICNSGNTRLSIARVTNACSFGYSFTWNVRWFAEGWYYVEPGECESLLRSESGLFGAVDCSGYYYFAFRITGKNGKGMMRYKADPGTGFFGFKKPLHGMENVDESFCVKTADGFGREGKRSSMDDCPNGWELVPFSIGMSVPWEGRRFKLTLNADRSSNVELFTPPRPPDEKTLAAVKKLDGLISGTIRGRQYPVRGAVTINADGLMAVTFIDRDGTYVKEFLLGQLDAAKCWVRKRKMTDGTEKIDLHLRARVKEYGDECFRTTGPSGSVWVSYSMFVRFKVLDDAEAALREIRAMIRHYSK